MPKTIVLNQATLHPKYENVDYISYTTWGATKNPDVRVIHYYGKYDSNLEITDRFPTLPKDGEVIMVNDNVMVIGTYDTSYPQSHPRFPIIHDSRNEKFILALEYCLNNFEFDYLQRICNTSYLDIEKMQSFFNTLPKTHIYNGARNLYNYKIPFVAGFNVFMSYDVVKLLVEYKSEYLASSHPEDLAAGKIIIYDTNYTSFDTQSTADTHFFVTIETPSTIKISPSPSTYCYRIQHNIDIFNSLHKQILRRDLKNGK